MRIYLIRVLQNDLEIALQSILALERSGCKVTKLKIFRLRALVVYLTLHLASLLCFLEILIIHKEKTKEITTVKEVWMCDPNYHKFGEFLLFISPRSHVIIK